MRSSSRPTTTSSIRSSASPSCAVDAASSPPAARCRPISEAVPPIRAGAELKFLWPDLLWLLLAIPVVAGAYLLVVRRRRKHAVRYANLSIVRDAAQAAGRWRRHVPPGLYALALVAMLLAVARPAAILMLPTQHETIILAMDISGSMRANDVEPT